ncbi:MAG: tetratricopeptide repeat protein [bacterium]|nr:tetratricopeptide repeat protein [bacterium]
MSANALGAACAALAFAVLANQASGAQAEAEAPVVTAQDTAPAAAAEEETITARPGPPAGQERPNLREIAVERKARKFMHRVNSRISRYVIAAMEAPEEGTAQDGLDLLARLNFKRLNPMERATVFQMEGQLHYMAGDLDKTIESFRKVINEEIFSLEDETGIRFQVAQLLAGLYRWDDAIDAIYEWFRWSTKEKPLAYYLLGIANFQLGNLDLAIVNTEKAIELVKEPKESWLQLLAALYVQTQDYKKAAPVLERLLTEFPKKNYWVQLSLIYGALEKYPQSLAVQQIAYDQGLLDQDSELRRLARAFLVAELPYPAALLLQNGIDSGNIESVPKSLELLANSWIQAREFERSLPPLIQAAEIAEDGNLFIRLGQVHLQGEKWNEAASAFKNAIEKGDLKKPGSAHLLLGIAYYNDGQAFRARSSFIDASKHESARQEAEQWIQHLDKETEAEAETS